MCLSCEGSVSHKLHIRCIVTLQTQQAVTSWAPKVESHSSDLWHRLGHAGSVRGGQEAFKAMGKLEVFTFILFMFSAEHAPPTGRRSRQSMSRSLSTHSRR